MSWYAIKRRRSDILFSEYIRRRDGRCIYAFKCYGEPCSWKALHCSHFQKRRNESTRFDPENCDATCPACHKWIEDTAEGAKALEEFKKKQLGEQRFNLLLIRANTYQKRDDFLSRLYAKQLLKSLEEKAKESPNNENSKASNESKKKQFGEDA